MSSIGIFTITAVVYIVVLNLRERRCTLDLEHLVYHEKLVDYEFGTLILVIYTRMFIDHTYTCIMRYKKGHLSSKSVIGHYMLHLTPAVLLDFHL